MNEFKHTPCTWKLVIDDSGGQYAGFPLCITSDTNDYERTIINFYTQYRWAGIAEQNSMSKEEHLANAKLIAAAPELLEALIELRNNVMYLGVADEINDSIQKSSKAIKKATN